MSLGKLLCVVVFEVWFVCLFKMEYAGVNAACVLGIIIVYEELRDLMCIVIRGIGVWNADRFLHEINKWFLSSTGLYSRQQNRHQLRAETINEFSYEPGLETKRRFFQKREAEEEIFENNIIREATERKKRKSERASQMINLAFNANSEMNEKYHVKIFENEMDESERKNFLKVDKNEIVKKLFAD